MCSGTCFTRECVQALMKTADKVLIGGAMAYCFLRAAGHSVGDSPCFADE